MEHVVKRTAAEHRFPTDPLIDEVSPSNPPPLRCFAIPPTPFPQTPPHIHQYITFRLFRYPCNIWRARCRAANAKRGKWAAAEPGGTPRNLTERQIKGLPLKSTIFPRMLTSAFSFPTSPPPQYPKFRRFRNAGYWAMADE